MRRVDAARMFGAAAFPLEIMVYHKSARGWPHSRCGLTSLSMRADVLRRHGGGLLALPELVRRTRDAIRALDGARHKALDKQADRGHRGNNTHKKKRHHLAPCDKRQFREKLRPTLSAKSRSFTAQQDRLHVFDNMR